MFPYATAAQRVSAQLGAWLIAWLLVTTGCSAPAPSEGPTSPEAVRPRRVLLRAIAFDTASDGLPLGIDPSSHDFGDLVRQAGTRSVVAPQVIADDNALTHLSSIGREPPSLQPVDGVDRALASYRLDVTPHVLGNRGVRLDVYLELAGKAAKTTVVLHDKQPIVLDNGASADGRRLVVVLRPDIIDKDADLRLLLDERTGP
jgi:hypothetical protein